jgi:hypothetical protein
MKAAEWKRFAAPLVGRDWSFSKGLAYHSPVGWVLRGLYAESTRSGGFYLWDVHLPLYWPSEVLALSWSHRLGGGSYRWDRDDATAAVIIAEARRISSEDGSFVALKSVSGEDNVLKREARAYGLVVESKPEEAVTLLNEVCQYDATYPWEHSMVDRAIDVRGQLLAGDLDGVKELVRRWRGDTASALGIELDVGV